MKINTLYLSLFFILIFKLFYFMLTKENGNFYVSDSKSYLNLGVNIFNQNFDLISTSRTFVYPLFIKLFHFISDKYYLFLIIYFQLFISLITAYLFYLISFSYFNNKFFSLIALVLYGIEPISNIFVFKISTETLFTFFLVFFVFLFQKFILKKNLKKKIIYLSLALLILMMLPLIRPIASFYKYIIFISLFYVFYKFYSYKFFNSFVISVFFIVIFFVVSSYFKIYSYQKLNYPNISSIAKLNFVEYILTHTLIIEEKINVSNAREEAKKIFYEGPENNYKINSKKIAIYLMHNADNLLISVFESSLKLFFDPGDGLILRNLYNDNMNYSGKSVDFHQMSKLDFLFKWYFNSNNLVITFISIVMLFIILCKFVFVVISLLNNVFKNANINNLFLISTLMYFIMISLGMQTNARFRVPVEPMIILFFVDGLLLTINFYRNYEKN